MMKKLLWIALGSLFPNLIFGQALSLAPEFATADTEITLTFDLTQAKDNRASGLLNQTAGLYAWAWGGADPANKTAEFSPAGQTNFGQAFAPGLLTRVSANVWSIKLTPSKYLSIPTGKSLRWMGVLVKNTAGTAQTEDFLFDLRLPNQISVRFDTPIQKNFFVEPNSSLPIKARASTKAQLTLLLDGTVIASANDTTLSTTILTGNTPNLRRTVRLSATSGTQTATDTFSFAVSPSPRVAALPSGLKNGINYTSNTSATLVLFAPEKRFIYAVGDFNNWLSDGNSLMNRTPDGQTYWLEIKNLTPQKEYAFQYLIDGTVATGDPYSEKILDRNNDRSIPASTYPNLPVFPVQAQGNIVSVLQTGQTPYAWKVNNFKRPDADNLVIYELLVRDFVGTQAYKTVTDSLPYLKRLGINAIELMPIMEFSGNDSWGYNPIYYTAPDKAYGTPNDLKAFIDKCHENGIAVILDMVLNQADFEFPYVKMYWDGTQPAKNSPMFNQQATHPFSVFFDFNHEAPATQAYVQRVNEFWLKEYRFDGFRFDLSKGFTQQNSGNDVARWGRYDASRVAIWKRIYDQIRQTDPTAYVILEHFADDNEEAELANYGMMLWDNQNPAFRDAIRSGTGSFSRLSWKEHNGFSKPAVVGYMESHDEERLVFEARNNGNTQTLPVALERAKALSALGLLTPGPKMIWQFGELGYDVSINENGRTGRKPIRWEYQRDANRAKLYQVYAELIKLKTTQAAFRTTNFTLEGSGELRRLTLTHPSMNVHVLAQVGFSGRVASLPEGRWFDYFTGQEINATTQSYFFQSGQFHVLTSVKLPTPALGLVPWTLQIVTAPAPVLEAPEVALFPNPATDRLTVQWQSNYRGEVMLEITDAAGKRISYFLPQKTTHSFVQELSVSHLSSGSYLLKIQEGDKVYTKKWKRL
jgi:1,4-alpha-glucan branching enzyme